MISFEQHVSSQLFKDKDLDNSDDWDQFKNLLKSNQSVFCKVGALNDINQLQESVSHFKSLSKKQLIHIGIGGSCLGTKAIFQSLLPNSNIIFLENIENNIEAKLSKRPYQELLFHIVSKSGNTTEVIFHVQQVISYLKKHGVRPEEYKNYFVLTSSQNNSTLCNFALEHNIKQFLIPKDLGGRFSALSTVSMFPCLFYEIDINSIIRGAESANIFLKERSQELKDFVRQTYKLYESGVDQNVLMPYDSKLEGFTQWFAQLWAESLGKKRDDESRVGITPITSLGSRDQHSLLQLYLDGPLNKLIIFMTTQPKDLKEASYQVNHALQQGCELALIEKKLPVFKIQINELSGHTLGEIFQFFHYACVYLSVLLKVNPYGQPSVELAKKHTASKLTHKLDL